MVEKFKNEETPSVKSTEEGASVEFDKSVEQRLMSRLAGPRIQKRDLVVAL